jgi:hypothetical protein
MRTCSRCHSRKSRFKDDSSKECLLCQASRARYRSKYKDRILKYQREFHASDPTRYKLTRKKWNRENLPNQLALVRKRRRTDPIFKLRERLRRRLSDVFNGTTRSRTSEMMDYLGCPVDKLREIIESKFQFGMTWENHGFKGWHIDHIIPLAAFDLNNIEARHEAFSWMNLQPLWARDNLSKGKKILTGGIRVAP